MDKAFQVNIFQLFIFITDLTGFVPILILLGHGLEGILLINVFDFLIIFHIDHVNLADDP